MFKKKLIWILIISAIALNFFDIVAALPLFEDIRYGHMLAKKLFLVAVALGIAFYWLSRQKGLLKQIKQSLSYVMLIGLALLLAHSLSFSRWFYFDDFRILSHHVAATDLHSVACCGSGYFPLALFHVVIQFFGMNFELYNSFGLFLYFLIGLVIFALVKQLLKKNIIALLISIFFVTSPTYFHEILAVNEFTGNGSALLLFVIAIYFAFVKFWPGVIIFTAAALELGLSRTHFMPIPLIFITWLFAGNIKKSKLIMIIIPIVLFLLALPYRNLIFGIDIFSRGLKVPQWDVLYIYPDMVFGVIVPHELSYIIIRILRLFFEDLWYLSSILGGLVVVIFASATIWLIKQKKILPAKLIFIGLVIILGSLALPSMTGSRVERNLKALTAQYTGIDPVRATSYGVFPTFGMVFIISGFAGLMSYKKFKSAIIVLIIFNTFTLINADRIWARDQNYSLKTLTFRLSKLFPEDGKIKIIHIPPHTRRLWDSLNTFQGLYRPKEEFLITGADRQEFLDLVNKYKLPASQLYFIKLHTESLTIIDFSDQIRPYYPEEMQKLMDQLSW